MKWICREVRGAAAASVMLCEEETFAVEAGAEDTEAAVSNQTSVSREEDLLSFQHIVHVKEHTNITRVSVQ